MSERRGYLALYLADLGCKTSLDGRLDEGKRKKKKWGVQHSTKGKGDLTRRLSFRVIVPCLEVFSPIKS